jgi:hypothetical protein
MTARATSTFALEIRAFVDMCPARAAGRRPFREPFATLASRAFQDVSQTADDGRLAAYLSS